MKSFEVRRFGPEGKDSHKHMFCVMTLANPEARRLNFSDARAAINGASSSDGKSAREACQRFCDELNAVVSRYMAGEFHTDVVTLMEQEYTAKHAIADIESLAPESRATVLRSLRELLGK